jgi:phage gpG-like protein
MPVTFRGDFSKLRRWADKADQAKELMETISKNLADESISLVRDGMNRGVDPYGKRYEPLVLRSGQPLKRTGGMFAAWHRASATAGSFRISNAKNYAGFHQHGTGIYGPKKTPITAKNGGSLRIPLPGGGVMFRKSVAGSPQRMMVPRKRLPGAWRDAYRETVNEIFLSHFRSR